MKSIVGTWKLIKTSSTGADGSVMPPPYGGEAALGVVTFDPDGRMVAALYNGSADLPAGKTREFNSYCGAYTYDGESLCTKVDASSNQAWLNSEQVREVAFEGELMVLKPPLRAYASQPEQRVLYWRKLG
ncbi:MAG: lipocalin-like domain-containing protein [Burkholderiaceae bacterium]